MSVSDLLPRIRCVSEFEDRHVDEATLAAIVEAAGWASSAANLQPWEIIAVRQPEHKLALLDTLLDSHLRPEPGGRERRGWIAQAPVILVICLDHTRAKVRFGAVGEQVFGIQDTGAAVQVMRLVALERGVKSCLIREFDRSQLAGLLHLPRHVQPLALLALGYSAVEPAPRPRLPLEDYLHHETW